MFRITVQAAESGVVMKLEGALTEPWVSELEASWRELAGRSGEQPMLVDLCSVCHVDASGRELMARMHRAGARFRARGCFMPEVVREIAEEAGDAAWYSRS